MPVKTRTSVAKWGAAPAIRIPKLVLEQAKSQEGDSVAFEVQAPGIIIVRVAQQLQTLEELVAKISPENSQGEIRLRSPHGNEVW